MRGCRGRAPHLTAVDDRESRSGPDALEAVRLARDVLSELDLEVVLRRVLESARELSGARYAALGVTDQSRAELERFITIGIDGDDRERIGDLPKGRGVLGELIAHPVPLRLADVGAHPHSYGFPPGHPPMRTFLGVPVLIGGIPYGNLYLTEKAGGEEFTEEDEQTIMLLAEFAGVAIDHARRYSRLDAQHTELKRTVDALDATMQIARALGGETDLDLILGLVAKRGRALVAARALVIEHEQAGEMVIAAGAGELPAGLVGHRVDIAGQPGQCRAPDLEDAPPGGPAQPHPVRAARPRSARRSSRRRIGGPIDLPRTGLRGADRGRPARRRAGVQQRGPAAAGGVRGQRGHGGRDRGDGRRASAAGSASRRPSRNALTGPASYTTRRCRTWPRCA